MPSTQQTPGGDVGGVLPPAAGAEVEREGVEALRDAVVAGVMDPLPDERVVAAAALVDEAGHRLGGARG